MRHRPRRVGDSLRAALADLLLNEVKDPGLGFVTVTEVRMSADLCHARVFVSVLGDADAEAQSMESLHRAGGFLRREVGRRVQLRRTTDLLFEVDRTLDQGDRIEELIREGAPQDPGEGEADATDG